MRSKSFSNSPEGNAEGVVKEARMGTEAVTSYNKLLSEYVQSTSVQPQVCASNVGDGSILLKATISPFPPLTSLITEEDWVKIVQKVKNIMHMRSRAEDSMPQNSVTEGSSKTPPSDSGTNNLVDPIKESPPASPERWSFSPTDASSPSSSRCEAKNATGRLPLKVRFHRLADDEYEVVENATATCSETSEGTSRLSDRRTSEGNEPSDRKVHKKTKKTKKRRVSHDCNVAYMIDESHLVENRRPSIVSSSFVNGNGSEPATNGDVHVEDLNCSLSKNEKVENSMNAMATWPSRSVETFGEADGNVEAFVTHHIWKKKQRRGEPVVKTSYVRRQGTPVTCTIYLRSACKSTCSAAKHNAVVPRRNFGRDRSRYSAPPGSSIRRHNRVRATKSASPQRVRPSRYWPVYDDDDKILLSPFMHTRSKDPSPLVNGLCIVKKEESSDEPHFQAMMPSVVENRENLQQAPVIKTECEDSDYSTFHNSVSSNDVGKSDHEQTARLARRRSSQSRPKKVRPRAGRRTGERVASDEEIPPDAFRTSDSTSPSNLPVSAEPKVLSSQYAREQFENQDGTDDLPLFEDNVEVPSEHLSADTDNSSANDGLCIAEDEPLFNKNEAQSVTPQESGDTQAIEGKSEVKVKTEPLAYEEDQSLAVQVYRAGDAAQEAVNENGDESSLTDEQTSAANQPVDPNTSYRYALHFIALVN
ncbi:unnamed protein product [Cylicostephanus goldi]|uniref:Uncharacterized protein n=1 Tax=Cylicostephanus goldi TaxID=71465 RepID=A0A3P6QHH3_CYLGO|nr:unnamed protein product [Cylicostephanus goldi]